MKLNEILNQKKTQIFEGVNSAVTQQKVYDYVLKKLKEVNSDFHYSYACELAKTTDKFFSPKLDDVVKAVNRAEDMGEIEDDLQIAIEAVADVIIDYFSDEDNHPEGYSSRKLNDFKKDVLPKDLEDLIKKIDPTLQKKLEKA